MQGSVNEMKEDADLDESNTMDPEDYSHAAESKDMELRLQLEAVNSMELMARLDTFNDKDHDIIENGAVVKTDGPWFLIGVSAPKINLGKQIIYALTEQAPIFASIQGKKKGDTIKLGNNSYTIKDIM